MTTTCLTYYQHFDIDATGALTHRYYVRDYPGSVCAVIDEEGNVLQSTAYYPSGVPLTPNSLTPQTTRLHTGKDFFDLQGAGWYDNNARYYDPILARFTTQDPLAETTPWSSSYVHCSNNPLLLTDPTGLSTHVKSNPDGTYSVIGGEFDDDLNIYLFNNGKKGNSIGVTTSITSFYHSEKEKWATGSIIDPNDKSGNIFLTKMFTDTPSLVDYIDNARTRREYDFKYSNGTIETFDDRLNMYRGMPISIPGDNSTIYTSARDIGNIAAGYVAGVNGFSWGDSRVAFDAYQSYTSGKFDIEGKSTRNAEYYGWKLGYSKAPIYKTLTISIFKSLFKIP